MTRAEAKEIIGAMSWEIYHQQEVSDEKKLEALNMAIAALKQLSLPKIIIRQGEQEPCDKRTDKRTETHACDCISRQDAIEALDQDVMGGLNYRRILRLLPSADRPTDEEDQLKFYYVESLDDYWVGRRLDNFYYATWHGRFGFIWSHSKYLPWGEHIVDENTLWKEHTYPSEPKEIPFTEWIVGFVKKYFADRPKGHWIENDNGTFSCSNCQSWIPEEQHHYARHCLYCGARMESDGE